MKTRPKHRATKSALTLALMLVAGSVSAVVPTVVCVGPGGHLGLELIFEGCGDSGGARAHGDAAELSTTSSGWDDCTDVQPEAPPPRSRETHQLQPGADAGCWLCSSGGVAPRTAQITGMDQRRHALASLTAVVLLT